MHKLALYPALFAAYPDVYFWKVEGSISVSNGVFGLANGASSLVLAINKNPSGGSCSISPLYGITMETVFRIECTDWPDPDGFIDKYEFYGNLFRKFQTKMDFGG